MSVLANSIVFISAITKIPHAGHTEAHVYVVIEQTIHTESSQNFVYFRTQVS
jgi:hypothetical protein